MKTICVIIPVYNEEDIIEELISRLQKETKQLQYDFKFIIIDDGSTDSTFDTLRKIQQKNRRIEIIKLSRNWGHQNSYNAGIDYAKGDAVILMDGDLEDPPELISEFVKNWEAGYEIVYGVKKSREENKFKKMMFSLFYIMLKYIADVSIDRQAGMFSLLDKRAYVHIRNCKEMNKYYVGLRAFIGFKQISIPYKREKRFAGRPKQSLNRLFNYALNAFFSFSYLPVRLITYSGICLLLILFFLSCALVIFRITNLKIWFIQTLPGWTSIVLILFILLGVQLVFMGILGEYIARILDEVRKRPYYIIDAVYESENQTAEKEL